MRDAEVRTKQAINSTKRAQCCQYYVAIQLSQLANAAVCIAVHMLNTCSGTVQTSTHRQLVSSTLLYSLTTAQATCTFVHVQGEEVIWRGRRRGRGRRKERRREFKSLTS